MVAINEGHNRLIEPLIKAGADLEVRSIHKSAELNNLKAVELAA